ncbi:MAG: glutamine amidotransferase [bacterium]|nr:glutamine amidotransferase [bacterium]
MSICHLYPQQMNIYADRGNIAVLSQRLAWRGLGVELKEVHFGDPIPDDCNLYYLGGGQDSDQLAVAEDLCGHGRSEPLKIAAASGAVILGVCGGYQLLGHAYTTSAGQRVAGVGLLDIETTAGSTRLIGDVVAEATLVGTTHTVVGYENHAGRTHLGPGCTPFANLQFGYGNNGSDGCEGAISGRTLGTYLHGPLLPKNPWLADTLLAWSLTHAGASSELKPLDDQLEHTAHAVAKARAGQKR